MDNITLQPISERRCYAFKPGIWFILPYSPCTVIWCCSRGVNEDTAVQSVCNIHAYGNDTAALAIPANKHRYTQQMMMMWRWPALLIPDICTTCTEWWESHRHKQTPIVFWSKSPRTVQSITGDYRDSHVQYYRTELLHLICKSAKQNLCPHHIIIIDKVDVDKLELPGRCWRMIILWSENRRVPKAACLTTIITCLVWMCS